VEPLSTLVKTLDFSGKTGVLFEMAGDLNSDGLPDLYIITEEWKQVIYTIR